MNANENPDRTNARSEAPAKLACREVSKDIVALQRDELSPLRAESIRLHLTSCPECREESLSLELAARDYAKCPKLVPPSYLVETTMRRIASDAAGAGMRAGTVDKGDAARRPRTPAPDTAPRRRSTTSARLLIVRGTSIFRRHVSNPFIRVAVAAALFIGVILLRNEKLEDAAGRAQRRLLGASFSETVDEARDAFLKKLRL